MYSNSIVKIEASDGTVEPEVDPFMDITSLRSRVKVEVFEGALSQGSVDLKPELPIPPGQNEEEFHPGDLLQVKIEESEETIKAETSESSDEYEAKNSSSEEEDNVPMGKYEGVIFMDVMEEFIKKYQPTETLLILLKSEPCLRYLPHFGSVRCEPCYLGIRKSIWKRKGSQTSFSSKKGHKFPERIHRAVTEIKQHISTTKHLHFTADSNNQQYPKESIDFDETGIFINDSILEQFKSKFSVSARSRLFQILESDMGGNQCLVYLQKHKSLRCEFCYQNNVEAKSPKYDFKKGLQVKRGLLIPENANNDSSYLARCIVDHFISDEHSAVVNQREHLRDQKASKRPKLSPPDGAKSGNSSSLPKPPLDGSAPMEINEAILKLIKSYVTRPRTTTMDLLKKDYKEDRCLVYLPALRSIRCELCFRDDGIRGISIKKRGDLVREGGMKDFNVKTGIIYYHLNSQRHIQVLLKEKRNGRDQKKSSPIESPSLINPVNVNEPGFGSNPRNFERGSGQLNGADQIELPGILIESVDIKEEKPII